MNNECRHKREFYTCKRMMLLSYLKNLGFLPELTVPDVSNPRYNVWKFRNSPELEDAIDRYFEELNNKK